MIIYYLISTLVKIYMIVDLVNYYERPTHAFNAQVFINSVYSLRLLIIVLGIIDVLVAIGFYVHRKIGGKE